VTLDCCRTGCSIGVFVEEKRSVEAVHAFLRTLGRPSCRPVAEEILGREGSLYGCSPLVPADVPDDGLGAILPLAPLPRNVSLSLLRLDVTRLSEICTGSWGRIA